MNNLFQIRIAYLHLFGRLKATLAYQNAAQTISIVCGKPLKLSQLLISTVSLDPALSDKQHVEKLRQNLKSVLAERLFCDELVSHCLIETNTFLTVLDDGSGSPLCGKTMRLTEIAAESITLQSSQGDSYSLPPTAVRLPENEALWTDSQHIMIEELLSQLRAMPHQLETVR